MHNIVKRSTLQLKELLQKHISTLPSEEILEKVNIDEILQETRPECFPQVIVYIV